MAANILLDNEGNTSAAAVEAGGGGATIVSAGTGPILGGQGTTDHGALEGLDADDHGQYLTVSRATTALTGTFATTGAVPTGSHQLAHSLTITGGRLTTENDVAEALDSLAQYRTITPVATTGTYNLAGVEPGVVAVSEGAPTIQLPPLAERVNAEWEFLNFTSGAAQIVAAPGETLLLTDPTSLPAGSALRVQAANQFGLWIAIPQTATTTSFHSVPMTGHLSGIGVSLQAALEVLDQLDTGTTIAATYFVTNYGAVGDGTTDDTEAIEDAVAAAATDGGTVVVPPGRYRIRRTLYIPSNVIVKGLGGGVITKADTITTTLTQTYNAGSTSLVVTDSTGFQVGDHVFIADTTNFEWNGTHARITAIDGGTDTLTIAAVNSVGVVGHSGTRAQYQPARSAYVKTVFPLISNVPGESGMVIRDLTLDQNYTATDPTNEFCVGTLHWVEAYKALVDNVTILNAVGDAYSDQSNEGFGLDASFGGGAANVKATRNMIRNSRIETCQRHATHLGTCQDGAYIVNNEMTDIGGRALFYCAYATNSVATGNIVTNFAEGFSLGDQRDTGAIIADNIFIGGARASVGATLYCIEPGPEAIVTGNRMLGVRGGIRLPQGSADCIVDGNYVHLTGTRECITILSGCHRSKVTNNTFSGTAATGSVMVAVGGSTAGVTDLLFEGNTTEGGYYNWQLDGGTGGITRCTIRNSPVISAAGNYQAGIRLSGLLVDLDLDTTGWSCNGTVVGEVSSPTLTRFLLNGVGTNGADDPATGGTWNAVNPATSANQRFEGVVVHWNDGTDHYSKYKHGTGWIELTGGGGGATDLDGLTDVAITTPADGQIIKRVGGTWVNAAEAAGNGWVVLYDHQLDADGRFPTINVPNGGLTIDSTITELDIIFLGSATRTASATDGLRVRLNGGAGGSFHGRGSAALTTLWALADIPAAATDGLGGARVQIKLSLAQSLGMPSIGRSDRQTWADGATVGVGSTDYQQLFYTGTVSTGPVTKLEIWAASETADQWKAGSKLVVLGRAAP